jgi:hypothetical protein
VIYCSTIPGNATRAKVLRAIALALGGLSGVRGARREGYKEELRELRAALLALGERKVDAPLLARLERLLD